MQLRCFPVVPQYLRGGFQSGSFAEIYRSWVPFSTMARLPIELAGAAGLFILFWPGTHPARRILIFGLLPALAGVAALCIRFAYVAQVPNFPHLSAVEGGYRNDVWGLRTLWSLGPALHMSVLGLTLVLVFLIRLARGNSSLPLSLAPAGDVPSSQDERWKRILIFVFIAITGTLVLSPVAGAFLFGVYALAGKFTHFDSLLPTTILTFAMSAAFAGVAAWAVGETRWKELRQLIRLPETHYGLLGVFFPIVIESLPNLVVYVSDRIHWAAFNFGKFAPPVFSSYFAFPDPLYFWYLIAAWFEEVIWRGYLQPRFVERYGLMRGIFLVGIAWSAFHFLGDFRGVTEDFQVLSTLIFRLTLCIAMSYVFGWLTLRSRSIWPAALAHGLGNVWAASLAYSLHGRLSSTLTGIIIRVCWVLLAFALYRFWPPSIGTGASDHVTEIRSELIV